MSIILKPCWWGPGAARAEAIDTAWFQEFVQPCKKIFALALYTDPYLSNPASTDPPHHIRIKCIQSTRCERNSYCRLYFSETKDTGVNPRCSIASFWHKPHIFYARVAYVGRIEIDANGAGLDVCWIKPRHNILFIHDELNDLKSKILYVGQSV